jgi:predicted hotdog family 3-hydroxylacyl-ACP dehydratase
MTARPRAQRALQRATRRPAIDFIPHRPPSLCIDTVGDESADSVTCYTTIRPDCVLLDRGVLRPLALIEVVAQACAVYVGVKASREGKPPQLGMLVGCREAEFLVDGIAVGDELTIVVHRVFGQVQVAAFTGAVSRAGAVVARVHLSVVSAEVALAGPMEHWPAQGAGGGLESEP